MPQRITSRYIQEAQLQACGSTEHQVSDTIGAAQKKVAKMERLLELLRADAADLGGFRVEMRCKGHGCPRQWATALYGFILKQDRVRRDCCTKLHPAVREIDGCKLC